MKKSNLLKLAGGAALGFVLMGCGRNETVGDLGSTQDPGTPTMGSGTGVIDSEGRGLTNDANRADIGIGGPVAREAGNYQTQNIPARQDDQDLANQIRVSLTTGSVGTTGVIAEDMLTDIQVQVENGVVTLSGPVSSEDEKKIIEEKVSGLEGVREVRNNLTVGGRTVEDVPLEPIVPRGPGNR